MIKIDVFKNIRSVALFTYLQKSLSIIIKFKLSTGIVLEYSDNKI